MDIVYLCVPYSHPDENVRNMRADIADRLAARLMERGNIVFSPISHSHRIAPNIGNCNQTDFWIKQDLPFLEIADVVVVAMLDGWEESKGIKIELEHAKKRGIPVRWITT